MVDELAGFRGRDVERVGDVGEDRGAAGVAGFEGGEDGVDVGVLGGKRGRFEEAGEDGGGHHQGLAWWAARKASPSEAIREAASSSGARVRWRFASVRRSVT